MYVLVFKIEAQIKVNAYGNTGLGVSNIYYRLHVKGNGLFVNSENSIISAPFIQGGNNYTTKTNPDFTWWNNDQTGFYHPGADKIGISTGGTERLLFDVSNIRLQNYHWSGGITVGEEYFSSSGYNMIAIYPNTDWYGMLGKYNKRFAAGYIDHVYAATYTTVSDKRLKENIKNLDLVLPKLEKLQAVQYDLLARKVEKGKEHPNTNLLKNRIGLIAQDVEEVFPSIVVVDEETGYYGVNYMELIPILIEAIKEQQLQINELKEKDGTNNGAKRLSVSQEEETNNWLSQNYPNPFNKETSIKYIAPKYAENVSIIVFDLNGALIKSYDNLPQLAGEIVIQANEFNPGMYLYSLIIDGQEIDNKRMILTQ